MSNNIIDIIMIYIFFANDYDLYLLVCCSAIFLMNFFRPRKLIFIIDIIESISCEFLFEVLNYKISIIY